MATLFKADGTSKIVVPQKGKTFSLEELQSYVDGDIECVHTYNKRIFVMNEEGKLRGLEVNINATVEYRKLVSPNDVLVGNVLLCWSDEIE